MKSGNLFNKAGKGNYLEENSIENVIRYILRQREKEAYADELLCWGGFGVAEWEKADGMISAFKEVQKLHTRSGAFGRYIDHEIYAFTEEEVRAIEESEADLDGIARQMAKDFFNDGTQVVYGVHKKEEKEKGLNVHIHFAVNTVDYRTGKKRRENKTDTKERSKRMNAIVQANLKTTLKNKKELG